MFGGFLTLPAMRCKLGKGVQGVEGNRAKKILIYFVF